MSEQQLKKEIAALQRRLSAMQVTPARTTPRKRQRNRRPKPRNAPAIGNMATPSVAPLNLGATCSMDTGVGGIRIKRTEFFKDVKGKSTMDWTDLGDMVVANFPWLKNLARAFDRITWHSAVLHYKPAVGTMKDGMVVYGVDWDSNGTATVEFIRALTPLVQGPVWQATNLALPKSRLMTRREYRTNQSPNPDPYDSAPGIVGMLCTGKENIVYGQIWVSYDVTLFGTCTV